MDAELSTAARQRGPLRPPYRPPVGLPLRRQSRWAGPLSVALHAVVVFLIVTPIFGTRVVDRMIQGAGGPGPAGGGGGGRRGAGGGQQMTTERLRYFQVQPPPAPPAAEPEKPPEEKQEAKPAVPVVDLKIEQPKTELDLALTTGIGGGTGRDGTSGTGPGSGGGVGSGAGTGRGSATGPGTGGGPGTIYPPYPEFMALPPMPVPERVKGQVIVLRFEVDERGRVLRLDFNPTRDRQYDQRIRRQFADVKFRPATTWQGTPVAATAEVSLLL